jgi:hypothetical protein
MPSLLEIYFSAQQLCFVVEYRELCVATESLPHEKYLDLMIDILSPVISSEDFDFLSDCVSTRALKSLRC